MFLLLAFEVVFVFFLIQPVRGITYANKDIKKVTHKINTTKCTWKVRGLQIYNGNLKIHEFSGKSYNHGPYKYGVCTFQFNDPVIINASSLVTIFGRNSLAIFSKRNISISSPFMLDWSPEKNRSDMWLGGFCSRDDGLNQSYGNGPGGGSCYGSAGHGGMGMDFKRDKNEIKYGWRYAYNSSNIALIGGSSGGVYRYGSGFSCGGGAIMISSDKSVIINTIISTNAFNLVTNDSCFFGGSGGTIIIKAEKVYLTRNASLVSRGAPENRKCPSHSGSGGVIVINGTVYGDTPDPHSHTSSIPKSRWNIYGVVLVNGKSKDRLPSLQNPEKVGNEGCYNSSEVFNHSVLPDYLVMSVDCKPACRECGYRYAVIHVKLCACVNYLDRMHKVDEKHCSLRCFVNEHRSCGGYDGINTYYEVYEANITSAFSKLSNISTPKTCPERPTTNYCKYSNPTISTISATPKSFSITSKFISTMPNTNNTTPKPISNTPITNKTTAKLIDTKSKTIVTTSKVSINTTSKPISISLKVQNTTLKPVATTSKSSVTSTLNSKRKQDLKDLLQTPLTKNNSESILTKLSNISKSPGLTDNDLNVSLTIFENIVQNSDLISSKNKTETERFGQLVLNIVDNLLNTSVSSWKVLEKEEKKSPTLLLNVVEQAATKLGKFLDANDSLTLNSRNFGLRIEGINPVYFHNRTYIFSGLHINQEENNVKYGNEEEVVFIPSTLYDAIEGSGPFNLHLLKYRPHSILVNTSLENSSSVLSSNIIAISVNRSLNKTLKDRVVLRFPLTKTVNEGVKMSCSFLDFSNELDVTWSRRGCAVGKSNGKRTECLCNHFTNFALLTDVKRAPLDALHVNALNWLTYIGCTVSLICLVATLTIFAVLKKMVCDHVWIHCNLITSLALAQLVFIFGVKATKYKILCKGIAITLQYLFTTAMFWMCIEGINLYRKVVKVFITSSVKKYYYVFGWGGPALVVFISALSRFDHFGSEKACWLSMQKGLIWAFVAPVLGVVLINLTILIVVIRVMLVAVNTIPPNGQNCSVKKGIKGVVFLLPILGLTWAFGVVAVNSETVVFQYVFTILNSSQGLFILLFHCIFNKDVRSAITKKLQQKTTVQRWSYESSWKSKEQNGQKSSLQTSRMSYPFITRIDVKKTPEQEN